MSDDNVHIIGGFTKLDIPANRVTDNAPDLHLALLTGYTPQGELWCASSTPDIGQLLILLERCKASLLQQLPTIKLAGPNTPPRGSS